jgi:hypothetical protein
MIWSVRSRRMDPINLFGDAVIKSSQQHLFRLIKRRPSRSLMSSIPFTGASLRMHRSGEGGERATECL